MWHKRDIRLGRFRRTQGWPRQLDGCAWDADMAENFDHCWRCAGHGTDDPGFQQVIVCDGICQRSIHRSCMGAEERGRYDADPDGSWLCHECAHACFPKPKGPKRKKEQRLRSKPPRKGSSNRNDPVRRTVLQCAIEDHRLRDDPEHPERPHAYLTYLLNTPGEVERRVRQTINHADAERGYTALHYATSLSCLTPAMVTLRLLELGADPNAQSAFRQDYKATPLHFALTQQDMNAILPLLSDPRTDLRMKCRSQGPFHRLNPFRTEVDRKARWALCLVFSVMFALGEQLIQPKRNVDEQWLRSRLADADTAAVLDALRFAFMVMRAPDQAESFRSEFDDAWQKWQEQPGGEAAAAAAAPRSNRQLQAALVDEIFTAMHEEFAQAVAGDRVPCRTERVQVGLKQWGEWTKVFETEAHRGSSQHRGHQGHRNGRAASSARLSSSLAPPGARVSRAVSSASAAAAAVAAGPAGSGRKRRLSGAERAKSELEQPQPPQQVQPQSQPQDANNDGEQARRDRAAKRARIGTEAPILPSLQLASPPAAAAASSSAAPAPLPAHQLLPVDGQPAAPAAAAAGAQSASAVPSRELPPEDATPAGAPVSSVSPDAAAAVPVSAAANGNGGAAAVSAAQLKAQRAVVLQRLAVARIELELKEIDAQLAVAEEARG